MKTRKENKIVRVFHRQAVPYYNDYKLYVFKDCRLRRAPDRTVDGSPGWG